MMNYFISNLESEDQNIFLRARLYYHGNLEDLAGIDFVAFTDNNKLNCLIKKSLELSDRICINSFFKDEDGNIHRCKVIGWKNGVENTQYIYDAIGYVILEGDSEAEEFALRKQKEAPDYI